MTTMYAWGTKGSEMHSGEDDWNTLSRAYETLDAARVALDAYLAKWTEERRPPECGEGGALWVHLIAFPEGECPTISHDVRCVVEEWCAFEEDAELSTRTQREYSRMARQEAAHQVGMVFGTKGYNDYYGY